MEKRMTLKTNEGLYLRNFILLCLDSLFFSFALGIFSYITVFPYYVSRIFNSNLIISLIPAIMFIGTNGFQIFSSVLCINSKNQKRLLNKIYVFQRGGFLLIFFSSIFLKFATPFVSLVFFLVAFGIFAVTNGYSQPVWASVVARLMGGKRGRFFGISYMVGGFSGIIGAYITKTILASLVYPDNFIYLYLIGIIVSIFSVVVVSLLKGETETVSAGSKKVDLGYIFIKVKEIFKNNHGYRRFLIGRSMIAVGEIATAFYIGRATGVLSGGEELVGILTMVMLISQSVFSPLWGYIGDRKGYKFTLKLGAVIGILIDIAALNARTPLLFILLFIMVGAILNGIVISNINLSIGYSTNELLPVFVAVTNIFIMPFTGIGPIIGGILADKFSLNVVFIISLVGYMSGFIYFLLSREKRKERLDNTDQVNMKQWNL